VVPEQGLVLGRVVELPPPLTRLPREKPLPQPAPPTRWEAYAKSKGIVKRKRSARVFDEEAGEWRGRHGYRRAGDASDVAVVEAAAWETTGAVDPFTRQRREKKARLEAQEGRQVANLVAAARRGGASALQPAKATLSSLPALPGAPMGARQEHSLKKAAAIARLSTASMGACLAPPALHTPLRRRAARCAAHSAHAHALRGHPALWRGPLWRVLRRSRGCTTPRERRNIARARLQAPAQGVPPGRGNADSFAFGTAPSAL